MAPSVTLLIPTFNAGRDFVTALRAMMEQNLDGELDTLVIDSGSTDGTVEFLQSQPIRLIQIPNSAFNHGLTRNLGIREAKGETVVLTVQDALPYDDQWLKRLVDCFDDPQVGGAYSCQLPRPDANPFIRDRLRTWAASEPKRSVQQIDSLDEFEVLSPLEKLSRVAFDNVSSAVRRSVALEIPFRKRQFGEDLDWGLRAVLAGYRIVFEPRSKVVHSHDNSIWYEFKRVYLDHQNLYRALGVQTVPTIESFLINGPSESRRLRQVIVDDPILPADLKRRWALKSVAYGLSQNFAQFLGARSAIEIEKRNYLYRGLDRLLRQGV